jgi:hypothetical protein
LYVGRNRIQPSAEPILGRQVTRLGEEFYQIGHYDALRPFFLSLVSNADHWIFISSTGGLTAGRQNPDLALFPYYTDDRIHDGAETTGSKTVIRVRRRGRSQLWEPFSQRYRGIYRVRRNLYKNLWGNKLLFEEVNEDLGLSFRYGWFTSERFGFVRRAWLSNEGRAAASVTLVDGLQNLMPTGVASQFQLEKSTLLDAYKNNELIAETGLGLFRLSSIPIDRPEPAEALRATTAWCVGLRRATRLLSARQLDKFRQGETIQQETNIRAERGAYFVQTELELGPGQSRDWLMVADIDQGHSNVAELNRFLRGNLTSCASRLARLVLADIDRGTEELKRMVVSADGLQKTAQPLGDARHFSNVLFNIMRGGVFNSGYLADPADLREFMTQANREMERQHRRFFRELEKRAAASPARSVRHWAVIALARETGDGNLERLCREYLPLTFSRRHGDPSRPWNRFNIASRSADGTRSLDYEGNWRDIFQNWEALAASFPGYAPSMVCRFVNASTPDGYNPYRITRGGFDWEVPDPADPWSHIGYWGDHQVIYLLKLLENLQRHEPDTLHDFLTLEIFSYANVPYRLKPYEQLLRDPKATVVFDSAAEELVARRVRQRGTDGKLVWDRQGKVRLVNLTEKLLVSLLAKFSNFIPGAGIWLNTQRPEWNDANNALVGNGVSMVTLYYLRRYLAFCLGVFGSFQKSDVKVSQEVANLLSGVARALRRLQPQCAESAKLHQDNEERNSHLRRTTLDALGRTGSRYREQIYAHGLSGRTRRLASTDLLTFFETALAVVDNSVQANRRPDGLYHAYNLVTFDKPGELPVRRLYEMLEGQVAVLSCGKLSPEESLGLLRALKRSDMYRPDQHSYLLYPDRLLPRFIEKNNIPRREAARCRLLRKLVADGNRLLVERDVNGVCHFNRGVTNAADVGGRLEQLAAVGYGRLVKGDRRLVLEVFERLFDHQSYTGRSGTFFGYEGLGCIYWHMVSKLLLAAQETFFRAADAGAEPAVLKALADCYYDIRAGIGDRKTPEVYGAFPMDPYSHTPGHAGARQPGLTGQVKEDILCRMGELGLFVAHGRLHFRPRLLRREEFLREATPFRYFDVAGAERQMRLAPNSLGFTYCQVPIVYHVARQNSLEIRFSNKARHRSGQLEVDEATSRSVFERSGEVHLIRVGLTMNP